MWEWFLDLHQQRGRTDFGQPVPLSHSEILAWAALMRVPVRPRDVAAIRALDRAWRAFDAEQRAGAAPPPPDEPEEAPAPRSRAPKRRSKA